MDDYFKGEEPTPTPTPVEEKSATFRKIKNILINALLTAIIVIIIEALGIPGRRSGKTLTEEKDKDKWYIVQNITLLVVAIVGLIVVIMEIFALTIVCGVTLILLAFANFVLGMVWWLCAIEIIIGVIALCFAYRIKKEVR